MERKKHILFLTDINSIHSERWLMNAVKFGYKVSVFSLTSLRKNLSDELDDVEIHSFELESDYARKTGRFAKLKYFRAISAVRNVVKNDQPDIIHVHYASSYGMLGMFVKHPNKILSIWGSDVYEFPQRSLVHKILFKTILKSYNVLCSTSKDMKREIQLYTNKKPNLTPFGIDLIRFSCSPKNQSETLKIGTVKTLEKVYGIDRLIHLFSAYHKINENSELLIYGEGAEKESLMALVYSLGLSGKVHFKGFVSGDDLVKAFHSLDIFVALSRRESFGVAVLEAQAVGLPVLVSDVGGLPEVAGPNSRVIDGDSISKGVEMLTELVDLGKKEGSKSISRNFVKQHFEKVDCEHRINQIYESI